MVRWTVTSLLQNVRIAQEQAQDLVVTHIFVQNNARRHQQLAKVGDINPSCLHLGKVDARLLKKLYAILGKHVIRKLELPVGQENHDIHRA